jgi:hypothetical protein
MTLRWEPLDELVEPRILAPGHCTGWRAKAALADRFAPDRYAPSLVGTRYVLPSAEAGNLKVMHVAAIAVLVGIMVAPGDL